MNQPGIKLVCLDLGRVLIRICDSWQEACRLADVPFVEFKSDGAALKEFYELVHRYEVGGLACDAFFERASGLARLTVDQTRTAWNAWTCEGYAGAADLLDRLREAGFLVACLSNTNPSHWSIFHDRTSHCHFPMERFDFRFASHLVGAAKPDEAIYVHVEQHTRVAPQHIAFFDDLAPNVASARARGWNAFAITPDRHPPDQIADHLTGLGVL